MSTNVQHFIYRLSSLASLANAQASFYQTPVLELLDRTLDDFIQVLSEDLPESKLVVTQEKFKNILENLHVHHKNAITNYYLSEFKRLVYESNQDQELKMVS